MNLILSVVLDIEINMVFNLNPYTAEEIVICFTLNFYQFTKNLEDILAEWQTAWNLTRDLVWFQAVCKDLTIMISRLKVNYLRL